MLQQCSRLFNDIATTADAVLRAAVDVRDLKNIRGGGQYWNRLNQALILRRS